MDWIIIDHAENLWLDDYAIQIKKLNVFQPKKNWHFPPQTGH